MSRFVGVVATGAVTGEALAAAPVVVLVGVEEAPRVGTVVLAAELSAALVAPRPAAAGAPHEALCRAAADDKVAAIILKAVPWQWGHCGHSFLWCLRMSLHVLRSTRPSAPRYSAAPRTATLIASHAAALADADIGEAAREHPALARGDLRRTVRAGEIIELMPSVPCDEVRLYASHADNYVVWWG